MACAQCFGMGSLAVSSVMIDASLNAAVRLSLHSAQLNIPIFLMLKFVMATCVKKMIFECLRCLSDIS